MSSVSKEFLATVKLISMEEPIDQMSMEGAIYSKLRLFMTQVSNAFRGVEFAKRGANTVWVYYPDEPYPMGFIGYGDFRTEVEGDAQYVVGSRTITNDKYGSYQTQHRMKMTTNIATGVRNAKRYLRNFSLQELAMSCRSQVNIASGESRGNASSEYRHSMKRVFDHEANSSKILIELRNLLNTEHEFIDASYRQELVTMFQHQDTYRELLDKPINMYFVRVSQKFGKQTFDVGTLDNVHLQAYEKGATVSDDFVRYTDNLPEDIMGKLAVLNMVDNKTYVDDVGYRADDSMFYVVR